MAVQKTCKVRIFGTAEKKEAVLSEIQKTGILHIIQSQEDSSRGTKDRITTALYQAELVLNSLEKKLGESMFDKLKPVYVDENEFFDHQQKDLEDNLSLLDSIWKKMQQKDSLKAEIQEKEAQLLEFKPWKKVEFSLSELRGNAYVSTILGKMPLRFYEEAVNQAFSGIEAELLYNDIDTAYLSVMLMSDEKESFLKSMRNYGFEEYIPAQECTSIAEEYAKLSKIIDDDKKQLKEIEKEIDTHVQDVSKLRLFFDYLQIYNDKENALKQVEDGDYSFSVQAWVAESNLKKLERVLNKIGCLDYEKVEPEKGEVAPVGLSNTGYAGAFEFVTDMYSLPGEKEPDPTPFLAPFFALFLAVCLTDAGYGLIMTASSWFALKKFKLTVPMQKLMRILRLSGIMTVIIGILTGGVFGIDFSVLSPENGVRQFIESVQLFNPSKDLMLFIGISLALGYIHVLFGFILSFIYKLKAGDVADALMDGLPWILIMLGGLVAGIGMAKVPALTTPGIIIAILGGVIIFLFSGRNDADGIVGQLLWGIKGVYDVTGVFGDILSYARLFALGLSTGIIGGVMNKLAGNMLNGLDFGSVGGIIGGVISIIAFVLILVGGHLFNLVISALGSFIHTMRLQFVEFFTKFFEGGGEVFVPFKVRLKYFLIKNTKK